MSRPILDRSYQETQASRPVVDASVPDANGEIQLPKQGQQVWIVSDKEVIQQVYFVKWLEDDGSSGAPLVSLDPDLQSQIEMERNWRFFSQEYLAWEYLLSQIERDMGMERARMDKTRMAIFKLKPDSPRLRTVSRDVQRELIWRSMEDNLMALRYLIFVEGRSFASNETYTTLEGEFLSMNPPSSSPIWSPATTTAESYGPAHRALASAMVDAFRKNELKNRSVTAQDVHSTEA